MWIAQSRAVAAHVTFAVVFLAAVAWAWPPLVTAAVAAGGGHAGADAGADADAAVLRRLREVLVATDPDWVARLHGWHPASPAHPCEWSGIACSSGGRVTSIFLMRTKIDMPPRLLDAVAQGPLLEELARLELLENLHLVHYAAPPWAEIPAQWLLPGAFPRLQSLMLAGRTLSSPLPDIPPGALPRLKQLFLEFRELRSTLPASWGASPAVLPQLVELTVLVQIQGSLPPEWATGFRQLSRLLLTNVPPGQNAVSATVGTTFVQMAEAIEIAAAQSAAKPRPGYNGRLPPQWGAAGAWPKLETLDLGNLDISGSLPSSWLHGPGLGTMVVMSLQYCGLTGTLPSDLLNLHPRLATLELAGNMLNGTLPAEWGTTASELLMLSLANNSLSGPAFPPAWLVPGALPSLRRFDVSGNPQLTGALPAGLPWPKLAYLRLAGTATEGSIPSAWCGTPLLEELMSLELEDTRVNPSLPCDFPNLRHHIHTPLHTRMPPPPLSSAQPLHGFVSQRLAAICLAALVPVVTMVIVGAAAGRILLQRRRPQQHATDLFSLLHLQQGGCAALAATDKGQSVPSVAGTSGSSDGRHERLAALVNAGIGGVTQTACSEAGVPHVQLLHHVVGASMLFDTACPIQHSVSTVSSCKDSGAPPGATWSFETCSLRMQPEQLQIVYSSGHPVVLGKGGQAVVFLARLGGLEVAAKVIELLPDANEHRLFREVALMYKSTHRRIVPLLGVAAKGGLLILTMELLRGGSLRQALVSPGTREQLRWRAWGKQVAIDVAEGLNFLHTDVGVVHNDIKTSNVLLTEDFRACISDLGVAQALASRAHTIAGCTFTHAAPEQLLGECWSAAADIYSFGVLLIELTTQTVVEKRGVWRLPQVPEECPEDVLAVIQECLSIHPSLRPMAANVLQRLRAASN